MEPSPLDDAEAPLPHVEDLPSPATLVASPTPSVDPEISDLTSSAANLGLGDMEAIKASCASSATVTPDPPTPAVALLAVPVVPAPPSVSVSVAPDDEDKPETLLDREERGVAELLTRFKNIMSLAAMPEDGANLEQAAAQCLQIETESQALVRAAEDLHQLTRELKELWLFGALRKIGEKETEGTMDEDSKKVGEVVDKLITKQSDAVVAEKRELQKSKKSQRRA